MDNIESSKLHFQKRHAGVSLIEMSVKTDFLLGKVYFLKMFPLLNIKIAQGASCLS